MYLAPIDIKSRHNSLYILCIQLNLKSYVKTNIKTLYVQNNTAGTFFIDTFLILHLIFI